MGTLGTSGPPPFSVALYFSLETYSSLGYGDVVPSGALRMMAGADDRTLENRRPRDNSRRAARCGDAQRVGVN